MKGGLSLYFAFFSFAPAPVVYTYMHFEFNRRLSFSRKNRLRALSIILLVRRTLRADLEVIVKIIEGYIEGVDFRELNNSDPVDRVFCLGEYLIDVTLNTSKSSSTRFEE